MSSSPRPTSGGSTPALRTLVAANVTHRVHAMETTLAHGDHGFGKAAAAALGVDEARVFKTLLVSVHGGPTGRHAVALVPVSGSLSLKAMASALGAKKVEMLDVPTAEKITGYVVGGISPLGQKTRLSTVIDTSAERYDTIFVSGGKRSLDVEVSPNDLIRLLDALTARIAE